jgi:Skp family chaperone for outer membrane proteins
VKKVLRWGVLATALMVLAGGTAHAQVPQATKVGVVNIGVLFTKYEKATIFKKELEGELTPLKGEAEKIKNVMKQHQEWLEKYGKDPAQAAQAEKSQQALRAGQRALEDLDLQARKLIGKKQETQLIQLYKEIHAAVGTYAYQNGFHVVFAYGDPPDQDQFTFQNINRKMQGMDMGAAVPYYWANGLDISNDVLARLNATYRTGGGVSGVTQPNVPVQPTGFSPKQ